MVEVSEMTCDVEEQRPDVAPWQHTYTDLTHCEELSDKIDYCPHYPGPCDVYLMSGP